MGIRVAPGSIKNPSSIYVGAGGVKTVKSVYIGAGSAVKYVWPEPIYDAGTLGSGYSIKTQSNSTYPQVTAESSYIKMYSYVSGSWSSGLCGAYFTPAVNMSLYKTLTMTFTVQSTSSIRGKVYVGGATSIGFYTSGASQLYIPSSGTDYRSSAYSLSSAGTYSLSLDVSSVTSALYVYVGFQQSNQFTTEVRVTKVEVSA